MELKYNEIPGATLVFVMSACWALILVAGILWSVASKVF